MDNIQNLELINVEYGPIVKVIFRWLNLILIKPDIDKDSLIEGNEHEEIKRFTKRRGKLDKAFEEKMVLRTLPLGAILFVSTNFIFIILNKINNSL